MGWLKAIEWAEASEGLGLEAAVMHHLRSNHFPPVPCEMVDPAVQAIELAARGDYDTEIETPYEHRQYGHTPPAYAVIEALHLEPFVEVARLRNARDAARA